MNVRKEIEMNVRAYHSPIKENDKEPKAREMPKITLMELWKSKISEMDIVELIRYCHPEDRPTLASKALDQNLLTKEEAKEFLRFVR